MREIILIKLGEITLKGLNRRTFEDILKKNNLDLDIEYKALNEENMKALHDAGIKVNCWTCNDPEAAARLAQWGIDYITSNILE